MPAVKPLVYLVLGAAGSGRREVLVDLIAGGLEPSDQPLVLLSDREAADPADKQLPNVQRWTWRDEALVTPALGTATPVFLVADGRTNPVDQVEAFKPWLEANGAALARVVVVVHCQLAEKAPALVAWYEACVHFADVVLLNRREGVPNKWLSDFQGRFKDQFYPCLIEFVKAGRVKNPVLILDPQARRMSHYFDEDTEWVRADGVDADEADEEMPEGEEEVEMVAEEDPYLVRDAANRRKKILPDITKYLGAGS